MRSVRIALLATALVLCALTMNAQADDLLPPDLLGCDTLQVPQGYTLTFHAFATGTQIYEWTGSAYKLLGPKATLYADPGYHGQVGTHFARGSDLDTGLGTTGLGGDPNFPKWESNSGSDVVGSGALKTSCTPSGHGGSIAWLLIPANSSDGPGVFQGVGYIQRVNTSGGKAPTINMGSPLSVKYTAEYFFYSPTE